jgi:hypothetical protein
MLVAGNVIEVDNINQVSSIIGGGMNSDTMAYVKQSYNAYMQAIEPLKQRGNLVHSFDKLTNIHNEVTSVDFLRKVHHLSNIVSNSLQVNNIHNLDTLSDFRNANPTMQRWIMAEPIVREMWNDGLLNGYGDSYVDTHPNVTGKDHYDYRRVMDGMSYIDETDGRLTNTSYLEVVDANDILNINEKLIVLSNWKRGKEMSLDGFDITDKFAD